MFATVLMKASLRLACVAANSFPFSGRLNKRTKSGRAKEHAWGEPKNWGEVGRGELEGGGGGEERNRSRPSPHPLPLLLYFATLSQFSSRSPAFGKGKETPGTQASLR